MLNKGLFKDRFLVKLNMLYTNIIFLLFFIQMENWNCILHHYEYQYLLYFVFYLDMKRFTKSYIKPFKVPLIDHKDI